VDASRSLSLRTRFGFNLAQGSFRGYSPITPENSEPTTVDGINENYNLSTEWTWSNTLNFSRVMNQHNLTVLVGQEANQSYNRFETASCRDLLNEGVDYRYIRDDLCNPTTKNAFSSGFKAALLSFFGKADYNFADRYYLSFTLRRDGSSRLGPTHRWGTFPAFGAGWRLSRESFLAENSTFSNVMLRFGWGVTGSQLIPPGRIVSGFGGSRGDTFYDIGGTNTSIKSGIKLASIGNADLKWEENQALNVGLDVELLQGRGTFSADLWRRNSNNLLFDPRAPGAASQADPPILNIGKMRNTGIDFSIGYRGNIGSGTTWSVAFNGAHYRNKILQIDELGTESFIGPISLREQNPVINQLGYPLGSFYGLVAEGYYLDSLDAAPYWNSGARPGRIKFRDLNNDGAITGADRTVIGSPHPDFTAGLDLGLRRGNWEVTATLFATIGNDIFDAQKYWYVFRNFNTNVRDDLLANSVVLDGPCAPGDTLPGGIPNWPCPGRVTNPNAKYPRIDVGNDLFSRQFSSYWVEDGSYVRLRTLQIAYNLPPALIRWIPAGRIYVQAENLFTITGYSGLDPALPAWSTNGAAGDIRDQFRGVDEGSYPSNRTFTIGITSTF
jgi:TonB-linked SusC/RagA family outer membrane protein